MPDTLVDREPEAPRGDLPARADVEPPPPTITDPPPLPAPARASSRARGCVVALAIALTLAGAAAAFVYLFVWRYRPTAREHIPDGAVLAVRVEAADVALFGPVKTHLWPLVDPSGGEVKAAPDAKRKPSRIDRIADQTGVNLARDVREVIVAVTDPKSWVVLVGGHIERGRFVKGMLTVLREEGADGWVESGELVVGPGGFAIGQADDGTIVLGTGLEVARAALPATDAYRDLELPDHGAVVFGISGTAWKGLAATLPPALLRTDVLRSIQHASGRLDLGDAPSLELRVRGGTNQDMAALAADLDALLSALRLVTLLAPDRWGEKEALAAAKVTTDAAGVVVRAPWPIDGIDRACRDLATMVRALPGAP